MVVQKAPKKANSYILISGEAQCHEIVTDHLQSEPPVALLVPNLEHLKCEVQQILAELGCVILKEVEHLILLVVGDHIDFPAQFLLADGFGVLVLLLPFGHVLLDETGGGLTDAHLL